MVLPVDNWKNKRGTSDRTCSCGSWKQHWINYSERKWPAFCSVEGCFNRAVLGAHVFQENSRVEYIIPMCDECNSLSSEFSIKDNTVCVPANVSETCG